VLLAAFGLAICLNVVLAQEPTPSSPTDDQVNAVAKQLYCPVCENVPLDVCGTQACAQWRALIREKLDQGWSEEEIKFYFMDQYGDRVLAEPPRRGLNWLVYIVPPLVFIAGVFVLFRGLRAWRQFQPESEIQSPGAAEPEETDEYIARLEEELRKH
jgi:cytochrome c-type biogenesis protein CcmH